MAPDDENRKRQQDGVDIADELDQHVQAFGLASREVVEAGRAENRIHRQGRTERAQRLDDVRGRDRPVHSNANPYCK